MAIQRYTKVEISVGAFVIAGAAALAYLSLTLGGLQLAPAGTYAITARFSSVGELKAGDPVKLAGVHVGQVERIALVDFAAEARMAVQQGVQVPEDTIASIQSAGLLGDAYVSLSPGGSDRNLADGGRILRTEPAVSLTELLAKYAFGSPVSEDDGDEGDELGEAGARDEGSGGGPAGGPSGAAPDPLE